jgi:hypothetical protein
LAELAMLVRPGTIQLAKLGMLLPLRRLTFQEVIWTVRVEELAAKGPTARLLFSAGWLYTRDMGASADPVKMSLTNKRSMVKY